MAHAALEAYLVSEACVRTLEKHSLVDTNTAARRAVERLHALATAADATPESSKRITVTDDEFFLIASQWQTHKPNLNHPGFGQVAQLRSYG
jgi:hypothetical protein